MTENSEPAGLPWRVGGNYALHAYAAEPWDVDPSKDRPVATFHRPADAALAVSRVNAHAALTARAEQAEAEVERLQSVGERWEWKWEQADKRAMADRDERARLAILLKRDRRALARVKANRDEARAEARRKAGVAMYAAEQVIEFGKAATEAQAERDAARAELAAAGTTDGLPGVGSDIDALAAAIYSAAYGIDYAVHPWAWTNLDPRHKPKYFALARLAQEAPTTKDDDRG